MNIRQLVRVLAGYIITMSIATTIIYALVVTVYTLLSVFGWVVPADAIYTWGSSFGLAYIAVRLLALMLILAGLVLVAKAVPALVSKMFATLVGSPLKSTGLQSLAGHPLSDPLSPKFWGLKGKKFGSKALEAASRIGRKKSDVDEVSEMLKKRDEKNTGKKSTAQKEKKKPVDPRVLDKRRKEAAKKRKGTSVFDKDRYQSKETSTMKEKVASMAAMAAFSKAFPNASKALASSMAMAAFLNRQKEIGNMDEEQLENEMRASDDMRHRMFKGNEAVYDSLKKRTDQEMREEWAASQNQENRDYIGDLDDAQLADSAEKMAERDRRFVETYPGMRSDGKTEATGSASMSYNMSAIPTENDGFSSSFEQTDQNIVADAVARGATGAFLPDDLLDAMEEAGGEVDAASFDKMLGEQVVTLGDKKIRLDGRNVLDDAREGMLMASAMDPGLGVTTPEDETLSTTSWTEYDNNAQKMMNSDARDSNAVNDIMERFGGQDNVSTTLKALQVEADDGNAAAQIALDTILDGQSFGSLRLTPGEIRDDMIQHGVVVDDQKAVASALHNSMGGDERISYDALSMSLANVSPSDREAVLGRVGYNDADSIVGKTTMLMNEMDVSEDIRRNINSAFQGVVSQGVVDTPLVAQRFYDMQQEAQQNGDHATAEIAGRALDATTQQRVESFIPQQATQNLVDNNDLASAVREAVLASTPGSPTNTGGELDVQNLRGAMEHYHIHGFDDSEIRDAISTGQGQLADTIRQTLSAATLSESMMMVQQNPDTGFIHAMNQGGTVVNNYDNSTTNYYNDYAADDTFNAGQFVTSFGNFLASQSLANMNAESQANVVDLSQQSINNMADLQSRIAAQAVQSTAELFDASRPETWSPDMQEAFNQTMQGISSDMRITGDDLLRGGRSPSGGADLKTERIEKAIVYAAQRVSDRARKNGGKF